MDFEKIHRDVNPPGLPLKTRWGAMNPKKYAFICAGLYGALAESWIFFSGRFVATIATSVEQAQNLEFIKGYLFVLLTSVLFYLFSLVVFRRMCESADSLVRSQQRLMQAERDAIAGLVASSVAHDFNNVLTVMNANIARLQSVLSLSPEAFTQMKAIETGARRLGELSARMGSSGRAVFRNPPVEFDVGDVVGEVCKYLRGQSTVRGCEIDVRNPGAVHFRGYPILLHQLLMNLLLNAAEATQGRGKIRVEYYRRDNGISIDVHDNGPGIPEQLRANIFEAFFTTKKFGTGLGLVSVRSCVDVHGGDIEIGDSSLGGACMHIFLPDLTTSRWDTLKMSESLNKNRSRLQPEQNV